MVQEGSTRFIRRDLIHAFSIYSSNFRICATVSQVLLNLVELRNIGSHARKHRRIRLAVSLKLRKHYTTSSVEGFDAAMSRDFTNSEQ